MDKNEVLGSNGVESNVLKSKIDFVAILSVKGANPNGDPLNGNYPRTDNYGNGEISDVCIKHKIRSRMVKLLDRPEDGIRGADMVLIRESTGDNDTVKSRMESKKVTPPKKKKAKNGEEENETSGSKHDAIFEGKACKEWADVRFFGQVFAMKEYISSSVRGPVTINYAKSVYPVDVNAKQITKCCSMEKNNKNSDTMGIKYSVEHNLYVFQGSINADVARKTGFTTDDAELLKECIVTLFSGDASAARPDGSMEVVKLYWFTHNSLEGRLSAAKIHRSVKVQKKEGIEFPLSVDDYTFPETLEEYLEDNADNKRLQNAFDTENLNGCITLEIIDGE